MILDFFLFFSLFLSRKRSLSLSFFLLFFVKGGGSEIKTGLDHTKRDERLSTICETQKQR